ncbi:MAG: hypothetical protein M3N19_07130, partial [Candidatus Eremiobacteraeota bacterium]|nr:hypothetical protein [Candidatus Eremiobacteraeota bacterium]
LAPWRIGSVGIPIAITDGEHDYALEARATNNPESYELSGDVTGTLTIAQQGITFEGIAIDGSFIDEDDETIDVLYGGTSTSFAYRQPPSVQSGASGGPAVKGRITSPMPGKIVKIAVKAGDVVEEHALLLVLEAMKMEHRIVAPSAGTIANIFVKEGELVAGSAALVELD